MSLRFVKCVLPVNWIVPIFGFVPSLMTKTIFFSPGSVRSSVDVATVTPSNPPSVYVFLIASAARRTSVCSTVLPTCRSMCSRSNASLILAVVRFFVAAVLDRSDARTFLDDRPDHDAFVSAVRFELDVVEQAGLPEIEEVLLQCVGVIWIAGVDAEVDADGVAGDGRVADGLEALDDLARLRHGPCRSRSRARRRLGNPA